MRLFFSVILLFVGLCIFSIAGAHESQPGTLDLRQLSENRYEVVWRAPIYYGKPHPARLQLPEQWQDVTEPTMKRLPDSELFRRIVSVGNQGVEGKVLRFQRLESTITDVFVRLNRLDGSVMTAVARPSKPYVELRGERSLATVARDYIGLGFHHILQGIDHLLFVMGLLLIVKSRTMLVKTVTAFTVAHSITLAIATLGYASVPLPPLNAAVALSILFLGPEIVRTWRGQTSLTIRYPWCVAFLFGLLHGFGFASGLTTSGMPKSELLPALLFFNVGVELGQLAFVLIVLALVRSCRVLDVRWPRWAELAPGYAVGSLGAFWTIQRVVIMFAA